MERYKLIVDMLASIAALVAIITVLISWYRSARKPLVIDRLVVHAKNNETTFILIVKNIKDHPVDIKQIECYQRKNYTVKKKTGQRAEYFEGLPHSAKIFCSNESRQIAANGLEDVRICLDRKVRIPSKLLFLMKTSHGYQEIWCSDILIVPIGQSEAYTLEYNRDFESKLQAKAMYWFLKFKELPKKCIHILSRHLRKVVR